MASEEGLIIEDVDLVFVIAFDLGDKVDAKELGEAFARHYPLVEASWHPPEWHPPEEPGHTSITIYTAAKKLGLIDSKTTLEEFIDKGLGLFMAMIATDRRALVPEYLELGRYTRFKLVELEAEVVEPDKVEADDREIQEYMREMVRGFRIEPYLLIHNAGIGIVTVWTNLKGKLTVDDMITLERRLKEIKLNLKDAFGNQHESITLREFVDSAIAIPLQLAVLYKNRYGDYIKVFEALGRREIEENESIEKLKELRDMTTATTVIVGVREVKCGHSCFTAEDVVKGHVKEIAGILTRAERWRDFRNDAAEENLGRNLTPYEHFAMYLGIGASLFLGSPKLSKEIEEKVSGSPLDKDDGFRRRMLNLVTPVEFLALSDKILDVYDSFYRKKRENFQERKRRGEVVNPSEYMELRSELTEALEEYRNVAFFKADPYRSILEYGKEVYRLTEWENVLRSALDELAELARTHYEERFAKSQLLLTVVFGIFGIFAEIEFLERLVGLQWAMAGAAMTVAALVLFYRWYLGIPYRKFWPLRQKVGRA
jgi:hypothetical protein